MMENGKIGEMRAVGKKYLHRGSFTKNVTADKIQKAVSESDEKVRLKFYGLIDNGKMTIEEASANHWHEVWSLVEKESNWFSYERAVR